MSRAYQRLPGRVVTGRHLAFEQEIEGEHLFLDYTGPRDFAPMVAEYNRVTRELQRLIGQARRGSTSLRARGSLWSLSPAAVTAGELINTKLLSMTFFVEAHHVAPGWEGDPDRLVFAECGYSIYELSNHLDSLGLSLPASGSNNGQTLVGAMSTGTHGAGFRAGAIHDCVRALHLVTADDRRSIVLQPGSRPVVQRSYAERWEADLVEDDELFQAALVSFGCFGVIRGVVLEARERFVLEAFRFWHPRDRRLEAAIDSLDVDGLHLPQELLREAGPIDRSRPYHFELMVNPNESPSLEACVVLMFEVPYTPGYQPTPQAPDAPGPGRGALPFLATLLGLTGPFQRAILNGQVRERFARKHARGTIRDLFQGEVVEGKTFATGMGLRQADARRALDVALRAYDDHGDVLPALFSMRFVRGSSALLAVTPHDPTVVFEVDSINTASTRAFMTLLWEGLTAAGIRHTVHWGKYNECLDPDVVAAAYEGRFERWLNARSRVLRDRDVGEVFSSPFARKVGVRWPTDASPTVLPPPGQVT